MFKSKSLIFLFSITFIILIITFPDVSSAGVTRGLIISTNVILPSLLPFIFCVMMVIECDFYMKNTIVNKILYRVFGQNFHMFFVFVLSLIGGYPVGAKLVNELYNKKAINNQQANILLLYCVNAGPAFVISVVGNVFNSRKIGIILFLSNVISATIIAILNSKKLRTNEIYKTNLTLKTKTFSEVFINSVNKSTSSIISICSFVILFSTINSYFDYFFKNVPIIKYISYFTEVTNAVTKSHNVYLISFLLGASGISIWCQIFALTSDINIKKANFIFFRIFHGTLSLFITKVLLTIFKIEIKVFSNGMYFKKDFLVSNFSLFIAMTVMLIVFMVFIYSKNNSGKILNDMI